MTISLRTSPFDAIRQTRSDGTEFWSARDLMPLMGYTSWRNFAVPLERALRSARNQGVALLDNFAASRKVSGLRGPASGDYNLSRFASYLVAMNGDPNKSEVAAAQAYFAVRTHEAETASHAAPELSEVEVARRWLAAVEERDALAAQVHELEGPAHAWETIASYEGDYSLRQAAQILCRDHNVETGQNRLSATLRSWKWVGPDGQPYQSYVDRGLLAQRAQYRWSPSRGERVVAAPQLRITPKGLESILDRLTGQRRLDVVSS